MNTDFMAYDYCLCYLDVQDAQLLAEALLHEITSYKLPKNFKGREEIPAYKKGCLMRLSPDVPLTMEQESLLSSCRWLMILCRPEVCHDLAMTQAIHSFIHDQGRSRILPILLEGEPQNAFPPVLFEERQTAITFDDGTQQVIEEVIEPLAIDIRGKNLKASLSLIRHVRIKAVAALMEVSYDTLEQRHEKRLKRRLRLLAVIGLSVPILFGSFFTYLWFNAQHQIDVAIEKTQLSKDLLAYMCEHYPVLFKDVPDAVPVVNGLLLDSLEKLRVAESEIMSLLKVGDLLTPKDTDDLEQLRDKAKILRYLGKQEESAIAYQKAADLMDSGREGYASASSLFTQASVTDYPCGVWVKTIDDRHSKACGLINGDIIVRTKGFKFRSAEQFSLHLSSLPPDQPIEVAILRNALNELTEVTIKIKPEDLVFESEEM